MRSHAAEGAVGPLGIVLDPPSLDLVSRIGERLKPLHVKA